MKRLTVIIPVIICCILLACGEQTAQEQMPSVVETTLPTVTDVPYETVVSDETNEEVDIISVPVTELVVSSPEEMPALEELFRMKSLRFLDLIALPYTPYSDIEQISRELPECRIIWNQLLTDGAFRSDSNVLTYRMQQSKISGRLVYSPICRRSTRSVAKSMLHCSHFRMNIR